MLAQHLVRGHARHLLHERIPHLIPQIPAVNDDALLSAGDNLLVELVRLAKGRFRPFLLLLVFNALQGKGQVARQLL